MPATEPHRPESVAPAAAPAMRVLLVDDSAAQRVMIARMLARWGFSVTEAASGAEALELCARMPQDLVLSDWMMPGMSGLDFCRRFRAMSGHGFGYFILLTSKSDTSDVAEGLDAGADDFLSKPVKADELRARLNAGARIVSMQRDLQQANAVVTATLAQLQAAHDAIDRDLQQARTIQEALVPVRCQSFGASRVSLLFKPCGHVGGDLVGMFSPGRGRLGIYGIDVSGHGITSAMVTARVAGYLNPRFAEENIALERRFARFFALRDPVEVARHLNARLLADPGVDEYLTMAYATVHLGTGEVRLVQAGHPAPLLMRAGGELRFLGKGGLPIGLVPDVAHERIAVRLSHGDRLLLFSDGITEAETATGALLGEDGLVRLVRAGWTAEGPEFLDELFWRLSEELAPGTALQDDVSAALLEYRSGRAR